MKLFTVEEANELLPQIRIKLENIRELYAGIEKYRDEARSAAEASDKGGGMIGGDDYVQKLYLLGKLTSEIFNTGVQLKDYGRGLIDFPSMRNGRIVLLCWQFDDGDEIQWWHEAEEGFAGRRRL